MRVTLRLGGKSHAAPTPPPGCDHATVAGVACPSCGEEPLRAKGRDMRVEEDRAYVSDATCKACGAPVGKLRAEVDTIFGIEEDERVLFGRCRVY